MKYEIKGGAFPVVVCELTDGERMITEKGSMVCQLAYHDRECAALDFVFHVCPPFTVRMDKTSAFILSCGGYDVKMGTMLVFAGPHMI